MKYSLWCELRGSELNVEIYKIQTRQAASLLQTTPARHCLSQAAQRPARPPRLWPTWTLPGFPAPVAPSTQACKYPPLPGHTRDAEQVHVTPNSGLEEVSELPAQAVQGAVTWGEGGHTTVINRELLPRKARHDFFPRVRQSESIRTSPGVPSHQGQGKEDDLTSL